MSNDNYKISWKWLVFIIFCIWAGFGTLVYIVFEGNDRGTFGDMFGAVNALFSGLAFAGVIIAILLQKDELALQREELKQTRQELKGQKIELQKQNTTLAKQNFETTFFQLLVLQHETAKHLELDLSDGKLPSYKGKLAIKLFYDGVLDNKLEISNSSRGGKIEKLKEQNKEPDNQFELSNLEENLSLLLSFNNKQYKIFIHYFDSIIGILEFIERSEILDKQFYMDLVKTQLSNYEKNIFFYYILVNDFDGNIKDIVKNYTFFRDTSLYNNEHKPLM